MLFVQQNFFSTTEPAAAGSVVVIFGNNIAVAPRLFATEPQLPTALAL